MANTGATNGRTLLSSPETWEAPAASLQIRTRRALSAGRFVKMLHNGSGRNAGPSRPRMLALATTPAGRLAP
jgi:hypothetical protein